MTAHERTIDGPTMKRFSLDGKVAVVTGSSRGIGKAIALGFAEAGATVVVNGRSEASANMGAGEVRAIGGTALPIAADVTDRAEVERLMTEVIDRLGRIDIMVNNAGISEFYKRAESVTEDDWDSVMSANLKPVFLGCSAAGRRMKEQGGGVILNVTSIGGLTALPRLLAYCAAKAGIVQLTRVLAVEWAQHGIRVNAIAPGWVETDMARGLLEHPVYGAQLMQRTPMNRAARPEEIAGAAIYLASEAASFVTGHTLAVDGGWTAW